MYFLKIVFASFRKPYKILEYEAIIYEKNMINKSSIKHIIYLKISHDIPLLLVQSCRKLSATESVHIYWKLQDI